MNRYLSLSRAARLVGVKRGTLQKRIQDGEILTFEGMLSLDDLLKAYPQTELEDNTMIERSRRIKENAVGKIVNDTAILPSVEMLSVRVKKLSYALAENKSLAQKYIEIVDQLQSKLASIEDQQENIAPILKWLEVATGETVPAAEDKNELIASDTLLSLMTAHIRILPSGHDFFVDGTSTILEAGLRSGLALNYACSNGNCGKCKARLISGEVNKISSHDYVLTDHERSEGTILMCCNAAVSDIVIEAAEATGAEDIPKQHITAKVKKVDTTRDDVALVHLKTPRTQRLRFLAGQYVTLSGNDIPTSDQSVSSCPCDDMNLHFQIPKITRDEFSDYVFENLKNGDEVDIDGPEGDFVLDENSSHSLTFIAWHTGFAPIRSLVEHAMALDVAETIRLIWITEQDDDRYLDNLCRSWNDALDNFIYETITADLGDKTVTSQIVKEIVESSEDISYTDLYVAGNSTLLECCEEYFETNDIERSQLKLDLIRHL